MKEDEKNKSEEETWSEYILKKIDSPAAGIVAKTAATALGANPAIVLAASTAGEYIGEYATKKYKELSPEAKEEVNKFIDFATNPKTYKDIVSNSITSKIRSKY